MRNHCYGPRAAVRGGTDCVLICAGYRVAVQPPVAQVKSLGEERSRELGLLWEEGIRESGGRIKFACLQQIFRLFFFVREVSSSSYASLSCNPIVLPLSLAHPLSEEDGDEREKRDPIVFVYQLQKEPRGEGFWRLWLKETARKRALLVLCTAT